MKTDHQLYIQRKKHRHEQEKKIELEKLSFLHFLFNTTEDICSFLDTITSYQQKQFIFLFINSPNSYNPYIEFLQKIKIPFDYYTPHKYHSLILHKKKKHLIKMIQYSHSTIPIPSSIIHQPATHYFPFSHFEDYWLEYATFYHKIKLYSIHPSELLPIESPSFSIHHLKNDFLYFVQYYDVITDTLKMTFAFVHPNNFSFHLIIPSPPHLRHHHSRPHQNYTQFHSEEESYSFIEKKESMLKFLKRSQICVPILQQPFLNDDSQSISDDDSFQSSVDNDDSLWIITPTNPWKMYNVDTIQWKKRYSTSYPHFFKEKERLIGIHTDEECLRIPFMDDLFKLIPSLTSSSLITIFDFPSSIFENYLDRNYFKSLLSIIYLVSIEYNDEIILCLYHPMSQYQYSVGNYSIKLYSSRFPNNVMMFPYTSLESMSFQIIDSFFPLFSSRSFPITLTPSTPYYFCDGYQITIISFLTTILIEYESKIGLFENEENQLYNIFLLCSHSTALEIMKSSSKKHYKQKSQVQKYASTTIPTIPSFDLFLSNKKIQTHHTMTRKKSNRTSLPIIIP